MIRLVGADQVKDIICKYEQKAVQRTIVFEIEKLPGVIATDEQMADILGGGDIEFEEE